LQSRGRPVEAEVKEFLKAGFKEEQILEVVLAIAVKTISNYANHLFNTKIDSAFESYSLN
jgi:alkylhydroperoxidase family enzyme